ncbi:MAG: glycoside hydrolase family 127 protein [Chloroflexi bacterium]|nr:glycoside hydrolase family 127 protein [Chloroflexota bacterium]
MEPLSPQNVRITGGFWGRWLGVNRRRAIFHQWDQLEASGCIDNFRIAAGEKEGFRQGWFFADSDAYKWLDAASRILLHDPDPALAWRVDSFLALLRRAQMPDGYLYTYNQIHFPGTRWVNLQIEHELYCHGHMIEAGVSHYQATGRTNGLELARRSPTCWCGTFWARGRREPTGTKRWKSRCSGCTK